MPKGASFLPRTLPPLPPEKPKSRAQRERDAKAYWDSLTEAQEVVDAYNENPKPFTWHAQADAIIEKIRRRRDALNHNTDSVSDH
jgi:hypothetical protein